MPFSRSLPSPGSRCPTLSSALVAGPTLRHVDLQLPRTVIGQGGLEGCRVPALGRPGYWLSCDGSDPRRSRRPDATTGSEVEKKGGATGMPPSNSSSLLPTPRRSPPPLSLWSTEKPDPVVHHDDAQLLIFPVGGPNALKWLVLDDPLLVYREERGRRRARGSGRGRE